jgi:hypothetical protein
MCQRLDLINPSKSEPVTSWLSCNCNSDRSEGKERSREKCLLLRCPTARCPTAVSQTTLPALASFTYVFGGRDSLHLLTSEPITRKDTESIQHEGWASYKHTKYSRSVLPESVPGCLCYRTAAIPYDWVPPSCPPNLSYWECPFPLCLQTSG